MVASVAGQRFPGARGLAMDESGQRVGQGCCEGPGQGSRQEMCCGRAGQVREQAVKALARPLSSRRRGGLASCDADLEWSVLKRPRKTHSP